MKALSFLLPALWALCSLTQPVSAQSNSTPSTGILTEDEYHQNKKNKRLAALQFNVNLNAWKAIIGKSTDNSITTITQTDANQYLKDELFNNGLLDDVKNLRCWHKDKDTWDTILSNRAIILRTTGSDPNNPSFVAASTCDRIKKTFLDCLANQNPFKNEDIDFNQILTVNVTKMAQKKRGCFNIGNNQDGGLKSSDASLRTTLVHEMGHQYVLANYPDLHRHHSDPNQSDPKLVDKLVIMCQEAFAVYTEYRYLQQLAKKGEIANFNFKDFLDDAYSNAKAVKAGNKYTSLYGVDLAYMYYFLCGLDWDGEPDESGCPPLYYLKLEKIANLCNKIRNNNLDISDIVDIKIKDFPLPIELLKDYMPDKTKKKLKITSTLSRTNRILQLNNQLAAKYKIDDFADLQTIAAKTPTNKTVDQYRAEYKKVSPDIRKQTFQVMLEYLSANQYMK
ncbi:MAG: hypothetical protein E7034_01470 [Akkermansiaceae bacterium]|nr:hypothetical protein [Akkermansiaceae bacterium]